MADIKKLKAGWFTFTCCEDSTILFVELINTHREWLKKIDFVHANILKTKNRWEQMDVAFVEGAICSANQEEKLKKIRGLATKLITIGACACTGMPSAQRNNFDGPTVNEIRELLDKFHQAEKVKTISQIVKVDGAVNGCPMVEQMFVSTLDKLFEEFGINN